MRRVLLVVVPIIIIAAAVTGTLFWHSHQKPAVLLLPTTVSSQVSFVIYYPATNWQTPINQVSYQNKVLTMHSSLGATTLILTQQATPDVFNDVPEYYPTLISKLNEYGSVGSVNGTAYLTKPKELNGQQQAVLNNNGTLLFVHPNKNLSDDDWRRFFNGLKVIRPN